MTFGTDFQIWWELSEKRSSTLLSSVLSFSLPLVLFGISITTSCEETYILLILGRILMLSFLCLFPSSDICCSLKVAVNFMLTLVASSTQHRFVKIVSQRSNELVYVIGQWTTGFNPGTPSNN